MKAEVLTIGDELLRGEIVDSNKSFLSDRLLGLDIETHYHSSVRDDPDAMIDAFRRAASRVDIVLVSGGLGPTRDDITIEILAETFGRKLVLDEDSLEELRAFFARLGRTMSDLNRKQAYFPEGSEILPNPIGTAPGCMLEEGGALFFCMPGVPRELHVMMDEQVMPRIEAHQRAQGGLQRYVRATLIRTFGLGESTLDRELSDLATDDLDLVLGFRTQFPDNLVRVLARADTVETADVEDDFAERALKAGARGYVMKGEPTRVLLAGIREVLAGNVFLSGRLTARIVAGVAQGGGPPSPLSTLTDREIQVFELLGRGLPTRSIAAALGVGSKTIETHCHNIKVKLGLRNANELVHHATVWVTQS